MWEDEEEKEYVGFEYGCLKYIGMVMSLLPTSVFVCKESRSGCKRQMVTTVAVRCVACL
jgi:hypothetical protein